MVGTGIGCERYEADEMSSWFSLQVGIVSVRRWKR